MSRLFEALSNLKTEHRTAEAETLRAEVAPSVFPLQPKPETKSEHYTLKVVPAAAGPFAAAAAGAARDEGEANQAAPKQAEPKGVATIMAHPSPESHLVAWSTPNSLGAEKFRALATRFDHLREQRELKSFQVTSSVIDEGKTLVAGNIAVTLAKYSGSNTLLIEGDLHRPGLSHLFGLSELRGLSHWWSGGQQDLDAFVYRLQGMPLWLLPAGRPFEQPSDLLRSERFRKAFQRLAGQFEWTVVDSTPMLPIVDVNLWSRMLDGTLLVIREGVAPVKALKRGLQALDHPKLIGVVVNEATELNQANYAGQYYGGTRGDEASLKGQ